MDLLVGLCNNSSMSKTILVELTEKEVEVIQNGIIKERYSISETDPMEIPRTSLEKSMEACHSVWAKLDEAKQGKPDLLITSKDLFYIKSLAKNEYLNLRSDLHISNKIVEQEDFVHISLANALIMWLNGNKLLKRLAKFDFTDHSSQYEEMDE